MKTNPVGWFEIYVQDMPRAKQFYETVFQVELTRLNSPDVELWSFPMKLDKWGAGGALVKMECKSSGANRDNLQRPAFQDEFAKIIPGWRQL